MRIRMVRATGAFLAGWWRDGYRDGGAYVRKGLPEGARLTHVSLDQHNRVTFIFEHESFEDIALGAAIPEQDILTEADYVPFPHDAAVLDLLIEQSKGPR